VSAFYNINYVILVDFSSHLNLDQNGIQINWTTQAEVENVGWNIIRGENENAIWNNEVITINDNPISGTGLTYEPTSYQHINNDPLEIGITYYYWLECFISYDNVRIYGPISCSFQWEGAP